jgi:hypothetical protein
MRMQVVPIRDPAVLAKIHQTYRIQYIKDVILPRSGLPGVVGCLFVCLFVDL